MEAAAAVTLEFQRGTLATVLVSTRAHYRTPLEIVGDAGVLRADNALNVERPVRLELLRDGQLVAEETLSNHLAYARQVDGFAAALEGREVFPVPGQEGWQNQIILDAAYRSLSSGKSESGLPSVVLRWRAGHMHSIADFSRDHFTANKKRPGSRGSRDARTALPRTAQSERYCSQPESGMPLLRGWNGTNGPRAKRPGPW